MNIKPGIKTTEFWMTTAANIVNAAVALLVVYGVLTREEADLWAVLVMAIAAAIAPVVIGVTTRSYNEGRVQIKTAELLERA